MNNGKDTIYVFENTAAAMQVFAGGAPMDVHDLRRQQSNPVINQSGYQVTPPQSHQQIPEAVPHGGIHFHINGSPNVPVPYSAPGYPAQHQVGQQQPHEVVARVLAQYQGQMALPPGNGNGAPNKNRLRKAYPALLVGATAVAVAYGVAAAKGALPEEVNVVAAIGGVFDGESGSESESDTKKFAIRTGKFSAIPAGEFAVTRSVPTSIRYPAAEDREAGWFPAVADPTWAEKFNVTFNNEVQVAANAAAPNTVRVQRDEDGVLVAKVALPKVVWSVTFPEETADGKKQENPSTGQAWLSVRDSKRQVAEIDAALEKLTGSDLSDAQKERRKELRHQRAGILLPEQVKGINEVMSEDKTSFISNNLNDRYVDAIYTLSETAIVQHLERQESEAISQIAIDGIMAVIRQQTKGEDVSIKFNGQLPSLLESYLDTEGLVKQDAGADELQLKGLSVRFSEYKDANVTEISE